MKEYQAITQDLCDFISSSPTCYHVIRNGAKILQEHGFQCLSEREHWDLKPGQAYYVIRSDSSIIAFVMPKQQIDGFHIVASHSDSPAFKIKPSPEITKAGHYVELNIEKYGGMLLKPWFDRPLGVAGRVCVYKNQMIRSVLVDSGKDLLMIPSLAIHMDRQANESGQSHVQTAMLPVFGDESASGTFMKRIAGLAECEERDVLGMDLFLYDRSRSSVWGASEEFFSSPRLDDQQCAYSSIRAITSVQDHSPVNGSCVPVCCIFDNEEVGSGTKQGADSTFLADTLRRISDCLGMPEEDHRILLASSFMLSVDNSHAVHPNHADKADPVLQPVMNHGVVIKWNAAQKYTTDAVSAAVFKTICREAGVPVQEYVNHADIPGGSTLGNISSAHVSLNSVDIGCAQLAMHSPYETAGTKDTWYMIRAVEAFYRSSVKMTEDGITVQK